MTTKFFNNRTEAHAFHNQLASTNGIAYLAKINYADALIVKILSDYGAVVSEEYRDICVTDDEELVTFWRERGYEVGYTLAGADERYR